VQELNLTQFSVSMLIKCDIRQGLELNIWEMKKVKGIRMSASANLNTLHFSDEQVII
jgi:hypothetical protein